jgi:hypothetical protein
MERMFCKYWPPMPPVTQVLRQWWTSSSSGSRVGCEALALLRVKATHSSAGDTPAATAAQREMKTAKRLPGFPGSLSLLGLLLASTFAVKDW